MGRLMTADQGLAFDTSIGQVGSFGGGFTLAAWLRRTAISTGFAPIVELGDGGANSPVSWFFDSTTNVLGIYTNNEGAARTGTVAVTSTTDWTFVCTTKATGTVTPRMHLYRPASGWTHENASGNLANAGGWNRINIGFDGAGDDGSMDMAAVMGINARALTDSEVERLLNSGKSWESWLNPGDFLFEFRSGRDLPVTTTASRHPDQSPSRTRQTATFTTTGTARSARPDPPGHRFSRLTRRR